MQNNATIIKKYRIISIMSPKFKLSANRFGHLFLSSTFFNPSSPTGINPVRTSLNSSISVCVNNTTIHSMNSSVIVTTINFKVLYLFAVSAVSGSWFKPAMWHVPLNIALGSTLSFAIDISPLNVAELFSESSP